MKEKLKSMKVKDKLYMGYGVVIGIMIFLGVFALGCLVIIYGNFNGYINGVEKANESVKNCRIEINIAARYLREMVLNDDLSTYQDYQQKVQECLLDVDTNLSVIKQVGVLDEALYEVKRAGKGNVAVREYTEREPGEDRRRRGEGGEGVARER